MADDDSLVSGAAGRYATALFDLVAEQGPAAIDKVAGDLGSLEALIKQSPDFERLVRSPVFSSDDQSRALSAIMDKAGFASLTVNFIKLVARNRRLFVLGDIAKSFRTLVARMRNEVTAEVTSAHPLNDAQMAELRDTLKASLGQEVRIATHVDPSILGGLIVKAGSRMIDSSIKTKLNSLKFAMKEVR